MYLIWTNNWFVKSNKKWCVWLVQMLHMVASSVIIKHSFLLVWHVDVKSYVMKPTKYRNNGGQKWRCGPQMPCSLFSNFRNSNLISNWSSRSYPITTCLTFLTTVLTNVLNGGGVKRLLSFRETPSLFLQQCFVLPLGPTSRVRVEN